MAALLIVHFLTSNSKQIAIHGAIAVKTMKQQSDGNSSFRFFSTDDWPLNVDALQA
jgi:hypothetical protein